MKRRTYRQAKQALEREKKQHSNKYGATISNAQKTQVPQTTFSQDTAEFDAKSFTEAKLPQETFQDLDTNEIFFEHQKEKQYLWSGPSSQNRKQLVFVIIILAILAIIFLGPTVFHFFATIFK